MSSCQEIWQTEHIYDNRYNRVKTLSYVIWDLIDFILKKKGILPPECPFYHPFDYVFNRGVLP